jgi:hypothetical protein
MMRWLSGVYSSLQSGCVQVALALTVGRHSHERERPNQRIF